MECNDPVTFGLCYSYVWCNSLRSQLDGLLIGVILGLVFFLHLLNKTLYYGHQFCQKEFIALENVNSILHKTTITHASSCNI